MLEPAHGGFYRWSASSVLCSLGGAAPFYRGRKVPGWL